MFNKSAELKKVQDKNKSLENVIMNQYYDMNTILSNIKILDKILSNTIKNEDGVETSTMSFTDVKQFATYIKAMNDINISFLEGKLK